MILKRNKLARQKRNFYSKFFRAVIFFTRYKYKIVLYSLKHVEFFLYQKILCLNQLKKFVSHFAVVKK